MYAARVLLMTGCLVCDCSGAEAEADGSDQRAAQLQGACPAPPERTHQGTSPAASARGRGDVIERCHAEICLL